MLHNQVSKQIINECYYLYLRICHSNKMNIYVLTGIIDELRLRENLKKESSTSTMEKPCQILNRNLEMVPTSSTCILPNKNALRQVVKRSRAKNKPSEPQSIDDIQVPDELKMFDDEPFLVSNTRFNKDGCVLIFSTKNNIRVLKESPIWIMDGTFQCCPVLFAQLYSIHGIVGDAGYNTKTVPLVYALLSSKSQGCYTHFFEQLKCYADSLNENILAPNLVMTDFEVAVINSVRSVFIEATHKCCLFRLGQNVWRRVQQHGLQKKYFEDASFALKIRHLIALAYLPPEDIPNAFNLLKDKVLPQDSSTENIIQWFETTYVKGKQTSRTSTDNKLTIYTTPPLFSPDIWSVHYNNEHNLPRTQNSVEAWHRRWNSLLNNKKIGLYSTIKELKKEQIAVNIQIERAEAGAPGPSPKKKNRDSQNAISHFIEQRNSMTVLKFLKGIASNTYL